jgi:hypothetical protein
MTVDETANISPPVVLSHIEDSTIWSTSVQWQDLTILWTSIILWAPKVMELFIMPMTGQLVRDLQTGSEKGRRLAVHFAKQTSGTSV